MFCQQSISNMYEYVHSWQDFHVIAQTNDGSSWNNEFECIMLNSFLSAEPLNEQCQQLFTDVNNLDSDRSVDFF